MSNMLGFLIIGCEKWIVLRECVEKSCLEPWNDWKMNFYDL